MGALVRYEIRERTISHPLVDNGAPRTQYMVWDTVEDKLVPFGRYSDRDMAERGLNRRNNEEN